MGSLFGAEITYVFVALGLGLSLFGAEITYVFLRGLYCSVHVCFCVNLLCFPGLWDGVSFDVCRM